MIFPPPKLHGGGELGGFSYSPVPLKAAPGTPPGSAYVRRDKAFCDWPCMLCFEVLWPWQMFKAMFFGGGGVPLFLRDPPTADPAAGSRTQVTRSPLAGGLKLLLRQGAHPLGAPHSSSRRPVTSNLTFQKEDQQPRFLWWVNCVLGSGPQGSVGTSAELSLRTLP